MLNPASMARLFDDRKNIVIIAPPGTGVIDFILRQKGTNFIVDCCSCDPNMELIGLPRPTADGKLEIVRPVFSQSEFVMFDQIQNAGQQLHNCMYELLLFGSCGGYKWPNLKTIWWRIDKRENLKGFDPFFLDRFSVINSVDMVSPY